MMTFNSYVFLLQAGSLRLVFGLLLYLISIPLGSCFLILAIFLDIFLLF